MRKKLLKRILKNQVLLDSKLNALLKNGGFDMTQFKTVNPTIPPPPPPTGDDG